MSKAVTEEEQRSREADELFMRLAAESSMMPVMCRKAILMPAGEQKFILALGSAGVYGMETKDGTVPDVPMRPTAKVAFCGHFGRNTLKSLRDQIDFHLDLLTEEKASQDGE
tara:strand:- start:57120 stop:57455 length:336 start_codon:yes stop_codon:yes gene_type:complete